MRKLPNFLDNPSDVLERMKTGTEVLRESSRGVTKRLQSSPKSSLTKQNKPQPIGKVKIKIVIDPTDGPTTALFNLEKNLRPDDWPSWESLIDAVDGVASCEQVNATQFSVVIGGVLHECERPDEDRKDCRRLCPPECSRSEDRATTFKGLIIKAPAASSHNASEAAGACSNYSLYQYTATHW